MYSDSWHVPTQTNKFFASSIVYAGVVSVRMKYESMHVRAGGTSSLEYIYTHIKS